jgi:CubicO group peptidase (beta-lactamase class C family)
MPIPLPRSTPLEQGVDPAAVLAFLDALEKHPDVEMHSLLVIRHGHVVAEGSWTPYSAQKPQLLYSLSKSFTATAVAFAQAEGLLDLDDTLVSHFPELDAEVTDARSRSITLRHLAAMASGHGREMLHEAMERDPQDLVRGFLLVPPDQEPGSVFAYSQPCTYALAAVVQRRSGTSLTAYLRPRLLDPLGIGDVGWHRWPGDLQQGFSGLFAGTEDVAKLGLLHLQDGRWGDTQLLPEDWVAQATTKQVDNAGGENPDWSQGYGFQFWMSRHGYRGDGAFGQFCLVLPEHDVVVATTALTEDMQAVLDACWTHLLPGLGGRVTADRTRQDELAARLHGLRLPPGPGDPAPEQVRGWTHGELPVRNREGDEQGCRALRSIRYSHGSAGLALTLVEDSDELEVPVGIGEWAIAAPLDRHGDEVPVAVSGGWEGPDTLRVRVAFLATPHRMDITCSLAAGTAAGVWHHAPLNSDRIRHLHCPGDATSP